jgi:hypothetical protein
MLIGAMAAWQALSQPFAENRRALAERINAIERTPPPEPETPWAFGAWQAGIHSKPGVWNVLTEAPPPPPPPPPPPAKCPDINDMLKGVKAARAQVGAKVKIILPDEPKGKFMAIGERINGCTLTNITKEAVEFEFHCKERDQTLKKSIPRE